MKIGLATCYGIVKLVRTTSDVPKLLIILVVYGILILWQSMKHQQILFYQLLVMKQAPEACNQAYKPDVLKVYTLMWIILKVTETSI